MTATPESPPCSRVLVVEDSADAREALQMLLSLYGYDVRSAEDGSEGVRLALEWRPDVVLSDIDMPLLDGWQLARRLRAALGGSIRLIAVTGYGQDEDRQRSLAAGFDFHLTKAADPLELLRLLGRPV